VVLRSGTDYLVLIIPVVLALFGWIGAVYWASYHARVRHIDEPARGVLAAGAADEDAGAAAGPGSVPDPRQPRSEPPPAPPTEAERADRTGSARGR
jgi:hypothetical protein